MKSSLSLLPRQDRRLRESGAVMLLTLICLVLLMIAAVALSRSSINTLLQAGNYSFKRDMMNQAERGMAAAVYQLSSGALSSSTTRQTHLVTYNYSATQLATNEQGIPKVLINDSTYSTAGMSWSDISDSSAGVKVRTVIDRQCSATGAYSSSTCVGYASDPAYSLSGTARLKHINASSLPTYRITVRVIGPRDTEFYAQMFVTL